MSGQTPSAIIIEKAATEPTLAATEDYLFDVLCEVVDKGNPNKLAIWTVMNIVNEWNRVAEKRDEEQGRMK